MVEICDNHDVVIPRLDSRLEPLHAIYSKHCLTPIREQLDTGELAVRHFLKRVRVRYLETEEIERFDPERLSFFNINVEADLDIARLVLTGSRRDQVDGDGPTT